MKHPIHIGYFARIPVANRLIEASATNKHSLHISARTRIPTADTWRAAVVKNICPITIRPKHIRHISHRTHIPVTDILIESHPSIEPSKHLCHISHRTHIPTTNRLIKWANRIEHLMHIRHRTRIPEIHITLTTKTITTFKHLSKCICSYNGSIYGINI